jgi:protein O-mannosyl-transferase
MWCRARRTAEMKCGTVKPGSRAVTRRSLLIIVAVVSVAVYVNSLFNGFVYDDTGQILENPWIRDIKYLPRLFSSNVWNFGSAQVISNYYRPLMHVIDMLTYHIFGLRPWGFHFVNVLFHTGVSLTVFLLASGIIRKSGRGGGTLSETLGRAQDKPLRIFSWFAIRDTRFFAFAAALLFATHPIHTEAVAWVAAIPEFSFTFFFIGSLYLFTLSESGANKLAYALSVAAFSLSLLCKEPAVTLPIVLIAYDVSFGKKEESFFSRGKKYVPYLIVLGIYFAARTYALGGFAPVKAHGDLSSYQYAINVFPLFARYLRKLLFPVNLSAFYTLGPVYSLMEVKGILGLAVSVAYIALSLLAYRKSKPLFFCMVLIAVPLIPALYIPGIGEASLAERYLYLPSAGFVMLLGICFSRLYERNPRHGAVLILIIAGLTGLYSIGTINRNPVWKDNLVLFTDTVKKAPDGELPRGMLANALSAAGRVDEAIEQYRLTLKTHPNSVTAYKNLGLEFMREGSVEEAIENYQRALAINPNDLDAHSDLGNIYSETGRTDAAIEQYRILVKLNPNSPASYVDLGVALMKKGLPEEAIASYQKALERDPGYANAHYNLGSALANSGKVDEAIGHFEAAVKLKPDDAFYHNILGITYGQKGLYNKAVEQFKEAVSLAPSEPAYLRNLERAAGMKKSSEGGKR